MMSHMSHTSPVLCANVSRSLLRSFWASPWPCFCNSGVRRWTPMATNSTKVRIAFCDCVLRATNKHPRTGAGIAFVPTFPRHGSVCLIVAFACVGCRFCDFHGVRDHDVQIYREHCLCWHAPAQPDTRARARTRMLGGWRDECIRSAGSGMHDCWHIPPLHPILCAFCRLHLRVRACVSLDWRFRLYPAR